MGSLFKSILPIGLSFLAPGIGTALGITSTLGKAALGAGLGALGSKASGGNVLQGAIGGGLGGLLGSTALAKGALGMPAGTTLAQTSGNAALQGATQGTGVLGAITRSPIAGSLFNGITGAAPSAPTGGFGNALLKAYGGFAQEKELDKQTKAMVEAQRRALEVQQQQFDRTRGDLAPFVTTGQQANSRLSNLLGLDGAPSLEELRNTPGYQFRLEQGQQEIDRSLGARGNLFSGQALKAAQEFGQGLADQTYQDALNRYSQAAGSGQAAAGTSGNFGQAFAGNAGQIYDTLGNIRANALGARGEARNKTLADLFGAEEDTGDGELTVIGYDTSNRPIYGRAG